MRFDIDDNWLIDSDATAVTLYRKIVITGNSKTGIKTKAENIGKTRESSEGSYGNFRDALLQYVVKSMRMDDKAIDITDLIAEMDVRIRAVERLAATFADKVPAPTSTPSTPLKLTPPLRPEPVTKPVPVAVIAPPIAATPAVVKETPKKPVEKPAPPKPPANLVVKESEHLPNGAPSKKRRFVAK